MVQEASPDEGAGGLHQSEERKDADHAIARLAAIVESSDDAIVGKDLDGIVTSWNPGAERLFGYSAAEMVGQPITRLIPPGRIHEETEVLARIRGGERVEPFDTVRLRKDASEIAVMVSVSPIRDKAGRIVGASKVARDITQRKRAEEEARAAAQRYQRTLDNMLEGCTLLDSGLRYLYVNDAGVRHGHVPREAVIGRTVIEAHPGIEGTELYSAMRRAVAQQVPIQIESAMDFADGASETFELSLQPEPEGLFVLSIDVTARKRADRFRVMQQAVTRVLAQSASLVEAAPGIIQAVCEASGASFGALWRVDPRANLLRCAELWMQPALEAEDLVAKTREMTFSTGVGLPGRVWQAGKALVWPDMTGDRSFLRREVAAKARLDTSFGFPVLLRGEVAAVMDFLGHAMHDPAPALFDAIGAIGTQVAQFMEHRLVEDQLRQAQKMDAIGQLAGGIAHDFNNILGVILGQTELAMREAGTADPVLRRLEGIHKAGERAAALTRQILTFSRKQMVVARACDLNGIVEGMETMLHRLLGEDVGFVVVQGENLGRISADPGQIEQAIMNLAVNARDAMPSGGRLVIETSNVELDDSYVRLHREARPGHHVMLAVSDSGCGMDPYTASRICEPFFTTKEPGKGTGLGLSVVYGIVKQSGGSLSVYSELGHGATFKIYFPRTDAVEERGDEAAATAEPLGGPETILVLEDEDILRDVLVEALRTAGYSVLDASNPEEALSIAMRPGQAIHLVITDVILPQGSGPETAAQIRVAHPRSRLLLMSGYTGNFLEGDRTVAKGTPFLDKPFTIDTLLRKVRVVLG